MCVLRLFRGRDDISMLIAIDSTERLTFGGTAEFIYGAVSHSDFISPLTVFIALVLTFFFRQFQHFVFHISYSEFRLPCKIIGNYVSCVEFEVESVESHFAEVCKNRAETGSIGKCAGSDEIVCNFVEVIDIQCDSVVKHREIESDVKLCCLFPFQSWIRHC